MEQSKFRVYKVNVQFPDKDEIFYTKTEFTKGYNPPLQYIILERYPDMTIEAKRFYVKGE